MTSAELDPEGLIENDHPGHTKKIGFQFEFPNFHNLSSRAKNPKKSSSSESSDVHCLFFLWNLVSVSPIQERNPAKTQCRISPKTFQIHIKDVQMDQLI